jgi:hypothetical protein
MDNVKKVEITTNWDVILLTTGRVRAYEERINFSNLVDYNSSSVNYGKYEFAGSVCEKTSSLY